MVTINASVNATSFVILLSLSLVWSVGIVGVLEVPERPPAGEGPSLAADSGRGSPRQEYASHPGEGRPGAVASPTLDGGPSVGVTTIFARTDFTVPFSLN